MHFTIEVKTFLNSVKIEKGAVEALKRAIRLHDRMNELLNEDDKGPSWDGDIYLYNNDDLKVEHIQYRIPTQIKGKCASNLLNQNSITCTTIKSFCKSEK